MIVIAVILVVVLVVTYTRSVRTTIIIMMLKQGNVSIRACQVESLLFQLRQQASFSLALWGLGFGVS